jgi:uncharacterized phiE125 gp8 family phage protein
LKSIWYRSLKVVTPPACEPVSLLDAKQHLRVDTTEDDFYIERLIETAREYVEIATDRSMITRQLRMSCDRFPSVIELPKPPAIQKPDDVLILYRIGDTDQLRLESSDFRVDYDSEPAMIHTRYNGFWPSPVSDSNSVEITWWAGYGDDPKDVPGRMRHAVLMLVAQYYERRLAADAMGSGEVPYGVEALLSASKWGAYS